MTEQLKRVGLCLASICLTSLPTSAQTDEPIPPPPTIAESDSAVTSTSPTNRDQIETMRGKLKALQQQRKSTVSDFQSRQQVTLQRDSSRQHGNSDIRELRRQFERNAATTNRQSQRIREKMNRLKQLVESGRFCREPPTNDEKTELPTRPDNSPSQSVAPERTAPTALQDDKTPNDSTSQFDPQPTSEPDVPQPAAQEPPMSLVPPTPQYSDQQLADQTKLPESLLKALSVVEGPVDNLRLANNLYGTGEYQLALEIYQKTDRSSLTASQQIWIEYQIANCFRQVGDKSAAERSYRIVVSRDRDGWLGKNARWWLDIGDQTASFQQSLKTISQTIGHLKAQEHQNDQSQD